MFHVRKTRINNSTAAAKKISWQGVLRVWVCETLRLRSQDGSMEELCYNGEQILDAARMQRTPVSLYRPSSSVLKGGSYADIRAEKKRKVQKGNTCTCRGLTMTRFRFHLDPPSGLNVRIMGSRCCFIHSANR